MIENVDAHAPLFAKLPGARVSFHPETAWHPLRTIELIRSCGAQPGIAVDPALPLAAVQDMLPYVSLVCIMTVNPGYAGQALIPGALDKIRALADLVHARGLDIQIEVDGNVSWENIPRMVEGRRRSARGRNLLALRRKGGPPGQSPPHARGGRQGLGECRVMASKRQTGPRVETALRAVPV